MKENAKRYLGDFFLLLVAIIWGFGFIAVKIGLNNGMAPFFLMFLRFLIAALALLPFQIKKLKTIHKKTWLTGLLLGLFLFLGFAFQTLGLELTTTSKNAFLTGVNVILVPFLTWFLTKQRVDKYSISAAAVCVVGIGLLTINETLTINLGDVLTLICAIMFAAHISVTSLIAKNQAPDTLVWIQMITGAFLSLIFALMYREELVVANTSSLIAILYLGLFSTMLAFFLQTIGQKYAHATKAAILLSSESLFGTLLAVLIFKDIFTLQMFFGCLMIFLAIIISETKLSFLQKQ